MADVKMESEELQPLIRRNEKTERYQIALYVYFISFVIGQTLVDQCFNVSVLHLEKAQKFAATVQFLSNTGSSLTAPFLLIFAGPWSDVHGRKFLIFMPTIGYLIQCSLWVYSSCVDSLNPWFVLLFFVPYYFTGTYSMTVFAGCCSICDVTEEENRSFSLGLLQGATILGSVIGNIISVFLVPHGYLIVFSVATCFVFLATIDAALLVKETVPIYRRVDRFEQSINKNIFRLTYLKEIGTFFKRLSGQTCRILMIILVARFVYILTSNGQNSVEYLFLQWKWNISLQEYALMNTFSDIFQGSSICAVTFFLQNKISDINMLILVMVLELIAVLPFIFGANLKFMYVGVGISSLEGLFSIFYKSYLSKIVDKDDVGKVLTVTEFGEAFSTISGVFLYTVVYQLTLLEFPAAVYLLAILGCIITLKCFIWILKMN